MCKYVIFGTGYEYTRKQFDEVLYDDDVKYVDSLIDSNNVLLKVLARIKYSRFGGLVPFKKNWFNPYHLYLPDKNEKIIFIFYEGIARRYLRDGSKYIEYLKEKYIDSKFVFYICNKYDPLKNSDISLQDFFDLIVTFDPDDAKQNNFQYYPQFLSKLKITEKNMQNSDVYFLGKVKDRLNTIIEIYDTLSKNNIVCNFILVGVPKDKQVYRIGIVYSNGISYEQNIQNINSTKAILEVLSEGQTGLTFRTQEAKIYKKKLITTNSSIFETLGNEDPNISIWDPKSNRLTNFINEKYVDIESQDYSPRAFLRFITDIMI